MATRADVARLAGVSPSTVSYVLNQERPTSKETQERVMRAIEQLNYVPNLRGSYLAARSLRNVGLHMFIERHGVDSIAADYIRGMRDAASGHGLSLVIPVLDTSDKDSFIHFLRSSSVDALIFMEAMLDDWREEVLLDLGFPAVILGSTGRKNGLPTVESDFEAMGRLGVDTAVEAGHRQALVLTRSDRRKDLERVVGSLMTGIENQARDRGLQLKVVAVPSHSSQAAHVIPYFDDPEPPTIIIGENGAATSATVTLARQRGIDIGPDFSIVTLAAGIRYGTNADSFFTEVATDRHAMGEACLEKAYKAYHSNTPLDEHDELFPPFLIDRDTVVNRNV